MTIDPKRTTVYVYFGDKRNEPVQKSTWYDAIRNRVSGLWRTNG